MVMTLVPQQKSDRYAAIKKLCCVENPVPSQVICLKTISNEKRLQAVAQKVVLQMNCKLGGELWGCQTPFSKLMVVGIDVFHDKSRKSGSIAGVVSSINDSLSRYYSTVAMQKQGQEIVDALKVALMESLLQYADTNNCWPETLIVFRDGVSDSQMDTVAKYEATQFLNTLRAADQNVSDLDSTSSSNSLRTKFLKRLPSDYHPQFAYVVVKKRISTRILLKKGANYENPPPGTVLDHTVTNFNFKDFFLVPQAVTQGTVTPTHMVVVQENTRSGKKFEPDDIQKLAYKLTHMYFNWPGTVRVPAPCQYAHKLVDLVGEHLHSQPSQELNDKLYFL
jgi:aubergine-like protein